MAIYKQPNGDFVYDVWYRDDFFEHFVVYKNIKEEDRLCFGIDHMRQWALRKQFRRSIKYMHVFANQYLSDTEKHWLELMFTKNRPDEELLKELKTESKYMARSKFKFILNLLKHTQEYFLTTDYKRSMLLIGKRFPLRVLSTVEVWTHNRSYGKTARIERCSISTVSLRLNKVIRELCNTKNKDLRKTGEFLRGLKKYVHH